MTAPPTVGVVIATCDRGDAVVRTIDSILANPVAPDGIWVVDQSSDERTREALRPYEDSGSCVCFGTPVRGLSRAHNLAIRQVDSEIVALTDDDCEVSTDWIGAIARAFEDPEIGLVFGNAVPAEHDSRAGLITGYVRAEPVVARTLEDKVVIDGLGACMAFRRTVWQCVGGFDEMLGAGTRLRAANDGDLAVRALRAGFAVAETPAISVVHHGYRAWPEARDLLCGYALGTGAMLTKHLRAGTPHIPRLFARLGLRFLSGRRHPPARLGGNRFAAARLLAFLRGCVTGLSTPIDRETLRFVSREGRARS
ncbi:MAG: glycosyltransferase [Gemmatimonadota bacterium]|nr:glycosyltransferase [Gemmatimonadota bacterium]